MDEKDVIAARRADAVISGLSVSPRLSVIGNAGNDNAFVELAIESLLPADSPRLDGEDELHTKMLAESDTELPPILVHRKTMRVIDGMHRVRATMLRGDQTIRAILFDGTVEAAFVAAVEANIRHGLPLSLADREAAASRIIASHPLWSDRAIATVSGISAKTVCAIRRGIAPAGSPQSNSRIGRDGRVRPVNGADGRRRACELFERRPNASLREVAREAGISPGTARDVRARMSRGEDPVRPRQNAAGQRREPATPERQLRRVLLAGRAHEVRDRATILRSLRHDPAVRFTDSGRNLLRWLDAHAIGVQGWAEVIPSVPPHCGYVIADLACAIAEEWLEVAESMRSSAEGAPSVDPALTVPPQAQRPAPAPEPLDRVVDR